jgi:FSR family fosmidomycin resistance protein-like MFS transporter
LYSGPSSVTFSGWVGRRWRRRPKGWRGGSSNAGEWWETDGRSLRALVFTSLGHFINDGSVFFVPLVIDLLAGLKGLSPTGVTVLLFTFYASSTLSALYVGREADRRGAAGPLVAVGISLLSIGLLVFYALMSYGPGPVLLPLSMLAVLVMGLGSAFYHPLGGSVLQNSFGVSRGKALGVNGSMGSLGRALYPSMFYAVASMASQPASIAFFGAVGFISSVVIWLGLRGFRTERKQGGSSARILNRQMVALTAVSFMRSASLFGIAAWIPVYLSFQKGVGFGFELGLALTAMYAAAIAGQPLFGYMTDRVDRRVVFFVSSVGGALSVLGYTMAQGLEGVILLSLFGFFAYTGFPVLLSLVTDYVPDDAASTGNALVWGLGATAGNAVGPLVIGGIILDSYSRLDFAFEVMIAVAIVSAFPVLLLGRGRRDVSSPVAHGAG